MMWKRSECLLSVPVTQRRFINGEHIGKFVEIEIIPSAQTGRTSESSAINIHYFEEGEGMPVIFIHGIGQSFYTWRNNLTSLSVAGYRPIILDLPGFGFSDKPDISYSIADMSSAIEAFVDALGIERADFVAFSTGALYLLDFIHHNPERAGKITLVSPGVPNDGYPPIIKKINSFLMRMGITDINEHFVEKVLDTCFFDKTFITKDVIREYSKPYKNKYTKQALMAALANYNFQQVLPRLSDIGKLCLILWSKDDKYNSAEIVELFHGPIKNAHLYTMRNCGHLLHEEKYRQFNEILVDFLNWRRQKKK